VSEAPFDFNDPPEQPTKPSARRRVEVRATEVAKTLSDRLSKVKGGSYLTPKVLLIGGGAAAVLLVSVVLYAAGSWMFGGKSATTDSKTSGVATKSGNGFTQRVLDADSDLFTKNKMRKPDRNVKNHPAGSKKDFLQAIELLGGNTYVGTWKGETSCTPNCQVPVPVWNTLFGDVEGLKAPSDKRAMTSNMYVNATWHLRCTDGSLTIKCDPIFGLVHVGKIILY
jgi:hypothetical protein